MKINYCENAAYYNTSPIRIRKKEKYTYKQQQQKHKNNSKQS